MIRSLLLPVLTRLVTQEKEKPRMHQTLNHYLRKSAFICGLFLLVIESGGAALAQGGGKAEPSRIEFKRGTSSTTISGVVRGDEEAEYVLSAKKGQHLKIVLTSVPAK